MLLNKIVDNMLDSMKLAMKEEGLDGVQIESIYNTVSDGVANNMTDFGAAVIILVGSPVSGFEVYGPFEDNDEAVAWAETELQDRPYWVAPLKEE